MEVVAHLRDNALIYQWPNNDPLHMELDITELKVDQAAHLYSNMCWVFARSWIANDSMSILIFPFISMALQNKCQLFLQIST